MAIGAPPTPDALAQQVWQEIEKNHRRALKAIQIVANGRKPRVGPTPRELIYRLGKARLYHYPAVKQPADPTPVLICPYVGISRTYVMDMLPGNSFIEHLVNEGIDVYLVDWGEAGPEDRTKRWDDYICRLLPKMDRQVRRHSGKDQFTLLGYCMGGTISAIYTALFPKSVRNLVTLAAPIDFELAGLFRTWLDPRYFNVDGMVDTYGNTPTDLVRVGFKMLNPVGDARAIQALWNKIEDDDYVEAYQAMVQWSNDWLPMPGEFFRQWIKEFYQQNKLPKGELVLGGRRVDLGAIACPVLVVGASTDYIVPPRCAERLLDLVSSQDRQYQLLPGGHIGIAAGRGAVKVLWPRITDWLHERSR